MPSRIWCGPFRGAHLLLNPRNSLRKVFGLYEHELNGWLDLALQRVNRVLDVGASDGYFTFGCAAAFRRLGKPGEIMAFEPGTLQVHVLRQSLLAQPQSTVHISIFESFVGRSAQPGRTCLDQIQCDGRSGQDRARTLIKIDVEGEELEVVAGARSWLNASNLFMIEVHDESFLSRLQRIFADAGLQLIQIDQRPLRWLGAETREKRNWWLVSNLSQNPA